MAIDERLNDQARAALAGNRAVSEVKMFGGIGFMLNGNMIAAASDRGLLVRVGPPGEAEALARPGARSMIMRGRAMAGYVRVDTAVLDLRAVKSWLRLARAFVQTLPPKEAGKKSGKQSGERPGKKPSRKRRAT